MVTLSTPEQLPRPQWQMEGYTNLQFGTICLALSLHAHKGLLLVSILALLNTRFLEYEHAYIGTNQMTLNAGTILVMPLADPISYQP